MPPGILLTGTPSQTSVEVSRKSEMSVSHTTLQPEANPFWRVLICVLLMGLFLYNPFLAVGRASGTLTVCHPASYRGTVASSELERFTAPNSGVAAFLPDAGALQTLIPRLATTVSEPRRYVEVEVVATPQTGFSASLWFRPPPAV